MSGFLALHLRRLGERPWRTTLTVIGLAVGTALFVAVYGLSHSLVGSVERLTDLGRDTDVEVSGITDTGFDQKVFFAVEAVEGVASAVPMVRAPAMVDGAQAWLFGLDRRALSLADDLDAELRRLVGDPGADLNGIFVSPRLAETLGVEPGKRLSVSSTGARARSLRLIDVLESRRLNTINGGMVAVAPLPVAQELTDKSGRLDLIYAVADDSVGAAELKDRVAGAVGAQAAVSAPGLLANQAAAAVAPLRSGMLTVAAMALGVTGFLIFNTMSMVALERRRDLATLRALGGRRRRLLIGFLGEAAVVGVVGSVTGATLGVLVGRRLVDRLPAFFPDQFAVPLEFSLPPEALPVVIVSGTALALVAASFPVRKATGAAPVEAMRPEGMLEDARAERGVRWVPTTVGSALVVAGVGLAVSTTGAASIAAFGLLGVGWPTVIYGLMEPLASAAGWLLGRFGASGQLAAVSVCRSPRRIWATATTVAVAVAMVVAVAGTTRNTSMSMSATLTSLERTDLVIQANRAGATHNLMPDAWAGELSTLDGVKGVVPGQRLFATAEGERVQIEGIAGQSSMPFFRLASRSARAAVLREQGVLISNQFARSRDLEAGDDFSLATPTGVRRVHVLEVVDTFAGESGLVVAALAAVQRWFERPGVTWFELSLDHDRSLDAARRDIQRLVADAPFTVFVQTGTKATDDLFRGPNDQVAAVFRAMQLVVAVGAALAVLNTLTISVVERRRELGMVRAIGTSRRQLRRSVLGEAAAVGAIAAGIGILFGLPQHYLAVNGTRDLAGLPVDYAFEPTLIVVALLAAITVTVAGALWPSIHAARLNVIQAIGYE